MDLLIQYNVLDEGTKAVSFTAEGTPASEEVGPGVVKIPGFKIENDTKEYLAGFARVEMRGGGSGRDEAAGCSKYLY